MSSSAIVLDSSVPANRPQAPAEPAARRRVPGLSGILPWAVLGGCLLAFSFGVPTIPTAPVSQFGLLAGASPVYGLSILLAAGGFAVAMRRGNTAAATAATFLMIICLRLPRAIATDAPMYAWTYKHLGVVDYIQQNHSLARGVDIYNGWPGLFALTAWFSDLTGVAPIDIAHWVTPVFHIALAVSVYAAGRAWRLSRDQSLTATFLVVTLNWVEQDYFAPQAAAMILTAGIVILLGLSRDRPAGVVLILILFAATTITHQLTPYWVFLAVGLLVVGRRMKPWWITVPMALMLIGFLSLNFDITQDFTLFSGDVVSNTKTQGSPAGLPGQLLTSTVMRLLSVGMWVATAIVLVNRWGKRQPIWALGVLALSPILILGGQNYGGEAVFRVFLYSLPGCAFVLAPALLTGLRAGRRWFAAAGSLLLVVTAMSTQAYFGSWHTNLISRAQVQAADEVLAGVDYPAYVTPLLPVWPERSSGGYVRYATYNNKYDHSLVFQDGLRGLHFDNDADFERLMTVIGWRTDASTYLVLSEPMGIYGAYFGLFPFDAMPNLRERLKDDPRWQVIEENPDVGVYLHRVAEG